MLIKAEITRDTLAMIFMSRMQTYLSPSLSYSKDNKTLEPLVGTLVNNLTCVLNERFTWCLHNQAESFVCVWQFNQRCLSSMDEGERRKIAVFYIAWGKGINESPKQHFRAEHLFYASWTNFLSNKSLLRKLKINFSNVKEGVLKDASGFLGNLVVGSELTEWKIMFNFCCLKECREEKLPFWRGNYVRIIFE